MKVRDLVRVGFFTSLTIIGAMISIDLGTIPITMQTVCVLLSGLVLGPRLGTYSQISYLLLGLIGLPVFAGGRGGLQSLVSPSFGFILGFVIAAYVTGFIVERLGYSSFNIILSLIVGTVVIFLVGIAYMDFILNGYLNKDLNMMEILKIGLIPFIPGEILKISLGSLVAIRICGYRKIYDQ